MLDTQSTTGPEFLSLPGSPNSLLGLLTDRDIVLIASVDWRPLWQTPQEVATRLAAAGNRVLYVENLGIRGPGIRDSVRVARRLRAWRRGPGSRGAAQGICIYSPVVLPPFRGPLTRWLNRRIFLSPIRRRAERLGMRDPLVWTWLPTDTALDLANLLALRDRTLIYFCIADFEPLAPRTERLRAAEIELLRCADLVFAHTTTLYRKCRRHSNRVELFPPSVAMEAFRPAPVPPKRPTQPVIGYVGGVHSLLDLDLVASCGRARPDWRWVLVGPVQRSTDAIEGLANVELAGPVSHGDLRDRIAEFDVCVVPYAHSPASVTVAPTKINEYLAVGKPVVATDLPWVVEFQNRYGVLQVVAQEPTAFVAGIERALAETTDADAARRRRAVAGLSDWGTRLESASASIERLVRASTA